MVFSLESLITIRNIRCAFYVSRWSFMSATRKYYATTSKKKYRLTVIQSAYSLIKSLLSHSYLAFFLAIAFSAAATI